MGLALIAQAGTSPGQGLLQRLDLEDEAAAVDKEDRSGGEGDEEGVIHSAGLVASLSLEAPSLAKSTTPWNPT